MIYFIQAENGAIKIGYTKTNPKARLNSCQIGCPLQLKLIHTMDGDMEEECKLHNEFYKYRIHGEWFKLPKRIVKAFLKDGNADTKADISLCEIKKAIEFIKNNLNIPERKLADLIGSREDTLNRIKNGKRPCPLRLWNKLISIQDFLNGKRPSKQLLKLINIYLT